MCQYCGLFSLFFLSPSHFLSFPTLPQQDYGRVPLGYEELFRRKQEQWAHHHHHHNTNRPSQSSPIFTIDFGTEVKGKQAIRHVTKRFYRFYLRRRCSQMKVRVMDRLGIFAFFENLVDLIPHPESLRFHCVQYYLSGRLLLSNSGGRYHSNAQLWHVCMCGCVCVCVREIEREDQRKREERLKQAVTQAFSWVKLCLTASPMLFLAISTPKRSSY